jgi:outer membrane protein OmpA-like peptidoglycan-associated protein
MNRAVLLSIAAIGCLLLAGAPNAYAIKACPNQQAGTPGPWYILFDIGSTRINADGMNQIKEAAKRIHDLYIRKVCLMGKADKQGNPGYNLDLSVRRAEAVANALEHEGVNPDVISIVGKGEAYGDWFNSMFQNEPQDRSVKIMLTK